MALAVPFLRAGDLQGEIFITRRLSRKSVTPPLGAYARGVNVALKTDEPAAILDLERSRVVVYLEGSLPTTQTTAQIVQENRRFFPDTVVVPVGSTVSFPNADPVFHNVFSLSKVKSFDLGNYARNQSRSVTFTKPGVVFVHCHLHPNMSAAILVAPNRYATAAGKDGKFLLQNVPPGNYTIVAWHRSAGFYRQPITVPASGLSNLQFRVPLSPETGGTLQPEHADH